MSYVFQADYYKGSCYLPPKVEKARWDLPLDEVVGRFLDNNASIYGTINTVVYNKFWRPPKLSSNPLVAAVVQNSLDTMEIQANQTQDIKRNTDAKKNFETLQAQYKVVMQQIAACNADIKQLHNAVKKNEKLIDQQQKRIEALPRELEELERRRKILNDELSKLSASNKQNSKKA